MSRLSQQQKILTVMFSNAPGTWFYPYNFMQPSSGDLFVGYEASARLSELAKDYPEMIESKQDGKYKIRRVCFETKNFWYPNLPKDVRELYDRIVKPEPVVNVPEFQQTSLV